MPMSMAFADVSVVLLSVELLVLVMVALIGVRIFGL
jgi:hypothetical protein